MSIFCSLFRPKPPDFAAELRQGIELDENLIDRVGKVFDAVVAGKELKGLKRIKGSTNLIFTFPEVPLVFKTTLTKHPEVTVEKRYQNMIEAVKICHREGFDKLYVPRATLFETAKKVKFIAEERLVIPNDWKETQKVYQTRPGLEPALAQFARFMRISRHRDVALRNLPPLDDGRIALVDLEHILMGECDSTAELIRDVVSSRWQLQAVIEALGDVDPKIVADKEAEFDRRDRLEAYHRSRIRASGPFRVPLHELDLPVNTSSAGQMTIFDFAGKLVTSIHDSKPSPERVVSLKTPPQREWTRQVLNAMQSRGYIFDYEIDERNLRIQL